MFSAKHAKNIIWKEAKPIVRTPMYSISRDCSCNNANPSLYPVPTPSIIPPKATQNPGIDAPKANEKKMPKYNNILSLIVAYLETI